MSVVYRYRPAADNRDYVGATGSVSGRSMGYLVLPPICWFRGFRGFADKPTVTLARTAVAEAAFANALAMREDACVLSLITNLLDIVPADGGIRCAAS
ncbi:hypothetical protein [Thalassospira sp.]|uniref:hypothetical protein n=1 Tax=Thalassospira sp. TaxID=1912094 RepID=UPI003AA8EB68